MDSSINKIDELLCGMLDGTLSEGDSIDLERAMAEDLTLKGRLEELAFLRRSLLSGRPTGFLGPDFAKTVTIQAKKIAAQMGENAPTWLASRRSSVQSEKSLATEFSPPIPFRRWIYSSVVALAATILVIVLSYPKGQEAENLASGGGTELLSSDPTKSSNIAIAAQPIPEPTTLPEEVVRLPEEVVRDVVVQMDSKAQKPLESVAAPQPVEPTAVVSTTPNTVSEVENSVASKLPEKPNTKTRPFFMMVLDVSIDPIAIENRALERILEKYQIVYTDELVISDDQLKNLEDSRMVGSGVANAEDKMGVMFLRSSASQLGSAIKDIITQYKDFPDVSQDLTMDPSAELLVNQLSSIKVAEGTKGFAGRLTLENSRGNSVPFSASARRGRPMKIDKREKFKGGMMPANPDRDEMSNALLLLRPANQ